jgi:Zn-dependent protease with chaperone function
MIPSETRSTVWTRADVEAFLPRSIEPVRSGFIYHAGLIAVAASLVILQAIYLAMVALVAWATWRYLLHVPGVIAEMQVNFVTILIIATPVAAGVIVTFFLLKPLLAKAPATVELLNLDRAAEPILFGFVERVCAVLGAPVPARIDIDLSINASAGLRRGWRSLFSRDMVLTLGLPLAAGLDMRQFSGVIAHEFGHFSQHAGMRLYFLIGAIRRWFARVAFERDAWDAKLEYLRKKGGWRTKAILNVAWATVEGSRYLLRGLLYCANIVSAWFSRQMEFDADRHAAGLAGADALEETFSLLPVLEFSAQNAWQTINRSWKSQRLCDDFALLVQHRASTLPETMRNQIVTGDFEQVAGRWSTHPSKRDRILRIRGIGGVATSTNARADALFTDFGALSRNATLHYYQVSLGDAIGNANLTPPAHFVEVTTIEMRRAEALRSAFGPLTMPARWFRLPERPLDSTAIQVFVPLEDESTRYWSLLDESLHRNAALEFIRAGGRINPAVFQLSSAERAVVETEERESRTVLHQETERLRERFRNHGYLFGNAPAEWRTAYIVLSQAQQDFLELRYRLIAMRVVCGNARLLAAALAANSRDVHTHRVREACAALIERFSRCSCPPLEMAGTPCTIAEQLILSGSADLSADALAERILERLDLIGSAILGELCARVHSTGH